jgi:hypothetical protein
LASSDVIGVSNTTTTFLFIFLHCYTIKNNDLRCKLLLMKFL